MSMDELEAEQQEHEERFTASVQRGVLVDTIKKIVELAEVYGDTEVRDALEAALDELPDPQDSSQT